MDYETNMTRVDNVLCSMANESLILQHKVALVESCVVAIDDNGHGVSLRVLDEINFDSTGD